MPARFGDDGTKDLFRRLLEEALQDLIDAEVTAKIGAGHHERTDTRSNYRNRNRERALSTPAGDVELRIPNLRVGSFFPSLLEPRRRVDKAPWEQVMTAYVTDISMNRSRFSGASGEPGPVHLIPWNQAEEIPVAIVRDRLQRC